jgi:hypothetical protein
LDIYKCPFFKTPGTFGKEKEQQYILFSKLLKEKKIRGL